MLKAKRMARGLWSKGSVKREFSGWGGEKEVGRRGKEREAC